MSTDGAVLEGGDAASDGDGAPVWRIRRRYIPASSGMPRYQREVCIRQILAEKDIRDVIIGLKNRLTMLLLMSVDAEALLERRRVRRMKRRGLPREAIIALVGACAVAALTALLALHQVVHYVI